MKIVIDIPEDVYKRTVFYREFKDLNDYVTTIKALENGTPFDRVLEIIDRVGDRFEVGDLDEFEMFTEIRQGVLVLKGEQG